MQIENEMTKVKVNNEIDFCEVSSEKVRRKVEAAFQYARVSYFIKWQDPSFFGKYFMHERSRLIFCLNSAQVEDALDVIHSLGLSNKEVRLLGGKAKNKYFYEK